MAKQKATESESWPLSMLKPHPRQEQIFGDVGAGEFEAFVDDIAKRGLTTPIEILPDGTIICGHQRVRAARQLGWKEIPAIVRHDLATAGPISIENHFLADNFARRQLSPVARSRCIRRQMELQAGDKEWGLTQRQTEKLKTEIGKQLNLSLRTVNRYLLVLRTPSAVQSAFDSGKLSLVKAGGVANLGSGVRERIGKRIEAGENPSLVVAEYTSSSRSRDSAHYAFVRLQAALEREVPLIVDDVGAVNLGRVKRASGTLRKAARLLNELAKLVTEPSE